MTVQPLQRLSLPTLLVIRYLLQRPWPVYGLEICRGIGLRSGSIYPILARLERLGWVTSEWEVLDAKAAGRPARRYYRLNPEVTEMAADLLVGTARALAGADSLGHGEREPDPGPSGRAAAPS